MKSKVIILTIILSLIGGMTYANTSQPTDLITRYELEQIIAKQNEKIDRLELEISKLNSNKTDEQKGIEAIEKNKPSVVNVRSTNGYGTGFFVSEHLILTASHTLDSDEVWVTLANDKQVKGKILKRDFDVDVALIQIDETGVPVTMNKEIKVGQTAIAIGNPLQNEKTTTQGIISFVNRSIRKGFRTQIDMPTNGGNSGGALINLNGEVIGMVVSKIYSFSQIGSEEHFVEGISYAVRVEDIEQFIK